MVDPAVGARAQHWKHVGRRRPRRTSHTVLQRSVPHVRSAGASRVEIMADFTDWSPVSLERAGDLWRIERGTSTISSGLHRVAIRLDGGEWIVPVNLPRVEDDLAGIV